MSPDWSIDAAQAMARKGIWFEKGLSLAHFHWPYGTEEQCEASLEKTCWPGEWVPL